MQKQSTNPIQALSDKTTDFLREKLTISQKYRNTIALGLFGFVSALVISLTITYYNNWFLRGSLGLSQTASDTIFSYSTAAGSLGLLVTVIVGGAISDDFRSNYGARAPFILAGCAISGITLIILPTISQSAPKGALIIILPLLFLIIDSGLGLGSSPTNALLSELFTREQRGWVGLIIAGFTTLGTFVGIIILRFIIDNYGINAIFTFTGILLIIVGIIIFFLVEKVNPPFSPIDDTITDIKRTFSYLHSFGGDFNKMVAVQSLWGYAVASISIYLIVHLSTPSAIAVIEPGNEGIVLIVTGLVAAIMAIPAGFVIQKFGKVRTATLGSIIYAIFCFGLAFMGIGGYYSLLLIFAALGGLGSIFIESVRVSLPADLVPEGKEAQFMGINKLAATWTQPIVSILGAQIIVTFAGQEPTLIIFVLAGIAALLATVVLFFISHEKMIKEEYDKFYKRYLYAKGIIGNGIKEITEAFL